MYNDVIFNIVDEIDHFTLRYRQCGDFDREKANRMIRRYSAYYEEARQLNLKVRSDNELEDAPVSEIYDELIKLRNVLLDKSELK